MLAFAGPALMRRSDPCPQPSAPPRTRQVPPAPRVNRPLPLHLSRPLARPAEQRLPLPLPLPAPALEPGAGGVAAPDTSSQPQARPKTKGVADVVFLIDVSGSMKPCIDALRKNIEAFIDSLSKGEANNAAPVRDWRGKVVGYRDIEAAQSEGLPWIVDNPFVRDAARAEGAARSD